MDVSRLVRSARQKAGLSQAQLAARAGTSQPAVSAYESGQRSPSVATLDRLLAACGARARITVTSAPGSSRLGPVGRLVTAHKREIREVLAGLGARRPRVFGSVARGEDTADSDLDLLVDLPRPSYVLLVEIGQALSDALGVDVDVTVESLLKDDVRERALAEAVPL